MKTNEEYLLRVLHRTQNGLLDSLIPAHGAKLTKLMQKLEQSASLTETVKSITKIRGFTKCAAAMEWLLERTKTLGEELSLEQFESDVLLLNEKLFEAFLNQPFDMPNFAGTTEEENIQRPVQQHIKMTLDEFIPASVVHEKTELPQVDAPKSIQNETIEDLHQEVKPETHIPQTQKVFSDEDSIFSNPANYIEKEYTPSLSDVMDSDLIEMVGRIAKSMQEFAEKSPNDRGISMAVIRVAAKTANESAQASSNVIVQDFFNAFLKVISYADSYGKIRTDDFAEIMHDIGDRLLFAIKQSSGGVTLFKNLTKDIEEPKVLFKK